MTGLENILLQIQEEAKAKALNIEEKARAKAKENIDKAENTAKEITADFSKKAQTAAENLITRAKAAGKIDFNRSLLSKKQSIIKDVIKKAKEDIKESPDEKYFAFLSSLLKKYIQPQNGNIILSKNDIEKMTSDFKTQLQDANLVVKEGSVLNRNGFILEYKGIEINCTIDAVVDAAEEELSDMLNEFLFSNEGGV